MLRCFSTALCCTVVAAAGHGSYFVADRTPLGLPHLQDVEGSKLFAGPKATTMDRSASYLTGGGRYLVLQDMAPESMTEGLLPGNGWHEEKNETKAPHAPVCQRHAFDNTTLYKSAYIDQKEDRWTASIKVLAILFAIVLLLMCGYFILSSCLKQSTDQDDYLETAPILPTWQQIFPATALPRGGSQLRIRHNSAPARCTTAAHTKEGGQNLRTIQHNFKLNATATTSVGTSTASPSAATTTVSDAHIADIDEVGQEILGTSANSKKLVDATLDQDTIATTSKTITTNTNTCNNYSSANDTVGVACVKLETAGGNANASGEDEDTQIYTEHTLSCIPTSAVASSSSAATFSASLGPEKNSCKGSPSCSSASPSCSSVSLTPPPPVGSPLGGAGGTERECDEQKVTCCSPPCSSRTLLGKRDSPNGATHSSACTPARHVRSRNNPERFQDDILLQQQKANKKDTWGAI
mmetsp:Transcript_66955/g.108568  ORF Transcript_66955/g.108568 Transcript_66955/m.108568 type:complete len:467 (-) Transcript_66955:451-1851(-)